MRDAQPKTPVCVLTGFLGSGKTTLLNAILHHPDLQDTAVVVNELGEIGLDHMLVEQAEDNVVLLNNGCLCCEVLNSFRETLADLHHRKVRGDLPPFRRVVAETTGMADPGPIIQTLIRDSIVGPYFRLGSVLTTVDAVFGETTIDGYWEARQQIAFADRIIVTKTDMTDNRCPENIASLIACLNPTVPVLIADYSAPTIEAMLGLRGGRGQTDSIDSLFSPSQAILPDNLGISGDLHRDGDSHSDAHDHHHHEHEVLSNSFIIDEPVTQSGLAGWIDFCREFFGNNLLRCKGILYIKDKDAPVLVQGVRTVFANSETLTTSHFGDRKSRLVCIYKDIDPELLKETLVILTMKEGMFRPATVKDLKTIAAEQETQLS